MADWKDIGIADLERQIAELRAELARAHTQARDNGMELCRQRSRAKAAEARADALAQALRGIVDTLDAEEMGEGPPASEWTSHWQKLHDGARAALANEEAGR